MKVHFPENLRDMRLFVAVYEERSFTAAAQREHATQSGVSQHIRKLEEMLGSQLLIRRPAGTVVPTPAGEAFYAGCISILRVLDDVHQKLASFGGELEGEVKIGVTPTIARCVLAPALSRFVTTYPNVLVHVTEAYSASVTEMLRSGTLDVAIVPGMSDDVGINGKLIARTIEHVVTSVATATALGLQRGTSTFPELKLVMPSVIQARRRVLDRYIATTGFPAGRRLEMDSMFGTLDFVASTDWATILPGMMLGRNLDGRLTTFPLLSPPLWLDLYRIESASRPTSAAAGMLVSFFEAEALNLRAPIELDIKPQRRTDVGSQSEPPK